MTWLTALVALALIPVFIRALRDRNGAPSLPDLGSREPTIALLPSGAIERDRPPPGVWVEVDLGDLGGGS